MVSSQFTEEDRQTLDRERFQYPDPRVQRKMEVLWLVSQGLNRTDAARLAGGIHEDGPSLCETLQAWRDRSVTEEPVSWSREHVE